MDSYLQYGLINLVLLMNKKEIIKILKILKIEKIIDILILIIPF